MRVELDPSRGTKRLWNPIIAEYYDYDDRPTVQNNQVDLVEDCANRLVEEYPTMSLTETQRDNEPESESESEHGPGIEIETDSTDSEIDTEIDSEGGDDQ